jgi:Xaa-Pro aminopeptidase
MTTNGSLQISDAAPPHRLERLKEWMEGERLDCVVLFGADHVNHLTGYWRYFGGPSAVVVGADGARSLVVMRDETRIASELADADEVIGFGERGFGLDLEPARKLVGTVAELPVVARARRIGYASELGGIEALLDAAVSGERVDAAAGLRRIRLVKDEDELRKILDSYQLCWLGQRAVADAAGSGRQEIELYTAAQSAAQVASGAPIEFVCDLLSGPNTAEVCCPIHVAGTRAVVAGDAVVADVVVRSRGYWGDTAETHNVAGNAELGEMRTELLSVLRAAGDLLAPGATGVEVFGAIDKRIKSAFPDGEFPHHGGHGLGLGSFDDPHLIPTDATPFEPWMVIAVEPGVYFPGRIGARVENVFVVTQGGGVELRAAFGEAHDDT